jgi:L-amino acid N-acyltransferase YncA
MKLEGFPQNLTLRDGREITIRPLEAVDGADLVAFYSGLPEAEREYLRDDVTKPDWIERFLRKVDFVEVVSLVAEHGSRLVGEGTLYRSSHGWMRHVGELRVSVAESFRRQGVGAALARALVKTGIAMGVEKLVVQMVDKQPGVRRTFEKLGFVLEATLKNHVKDLHGHKRDLFLLANDVSHIWQAMETMVADYHPDSE